MAFLSRSSLTTAPTVWSTWSRKYSSDLWQKTTRSKLQYYSCIKTFESSAPNCYVHYSIQRQWTIQHAYNLQQWRVAKQQGDHDVQCETYNLNRILSGSENVKHITWTESYLEVKMLKWCACILKKSLQDLEKWLWCFEKWRWWRQMREAPWWWKSENHNCLTRWMGKYWTYIPKVLCSGTVVKGKCAERGMCWK